MAYNDHRNEQHDRDERHRRQDQMDQYADSQRQYGSQAYRDQGQRDAANWGAQRDDGLQRADAAQTSYGRYGAPDVHGQPTGGYARPVYEPARLPYGQYERRGWHAQDGRDPSAGRNPGGPGTHAYGYGYDDGQHRYQGGAGGYRSNAGPYAGSQTYGGYGDQLGYGSGSDRQERGRAHDPDYQQWREQQLRRLDEDYASWRGERYQKFSEEFDQWRRNREGKAGQDGAGSAASSQDGGSSKAK